MLQNEMNHTAARLQRERAQAEHKRRWLAFLAHCRNDPEAYEARQPYQERYLIKECLLHVGVLVITYTPDDKHYTLRLIFNNGPVKCLLHVKPTIYDEAAYYCKNPIINHPGGYLNVYKLFADVWMATVQWDVPDVLEWLLEMSEKV
jgi:hypothetical protein